MNGGMGGRSEIKMPDQREREGGGVGMDHSLSSAEEIRLLQAVPRRETLQVMEVAVRASTTTMRLALDHRAPARRFYDKDGRLHLKSVNLSRECVSPYRGREIPGWKSLGLDPDRTYRLLRPESELRAAAHTFRNLPLMRDHIPGRSRDICPRRKSGRGHRWRRPLHRPVSERRDLHLVAGFHRCR